MLLVCLNFDVVGMHSVMVFIRLDDPQTSLMRTGAPLFVINLLQVTFSSGLTSKFGTRYNSYCIHLTAAPIFSVYVKIIVGNLY